MSGPTVVGISGFARSGKDTAAQALVALGWRRAAFADALKRDVMVTMGSAAEAAGIPKDRFPRWAWFEDPDMKERLRPLLVEYGRAMRLVDPDYWVRRLRHDYVHGPGAFVIPDVRYANEAAWIRGLGGVVVGVVRDGAGPANAEERESLLAFSPDVTVINGGTVEAFHSSLLRLLREAGVDVRDRAARGPA